MTGVHGPGGSAGVDYLEEDRPTVPMGYSGWGVRTLDEYLRLRHEK